MEKCHVCETNQKAIQQIMRLDNLLTFDWKILGRINLTILNIRNRKVNLLIQNKFMCMKRGGVHIIQTM